MRVVAFIYEVVRSTYGDSAKTFLSEGQVFFPEAPDQLSCNFNVSTRLDRAGPLTTCGLGGQKKIFQKGLAACLAGRPVQETFRAVVCPNWECAHLFGRK